MKRKGESIESVLARRVPGKLIPLSKIYLGPWPAKVEIPKWTMKK